MSDSYAAYEHERMMAERAALSVLISGQVVQAGTDTEGNPVVVVLVSREDLMVMRPNALYRRVSIVLKEEGSK